MRPVSVPLNVSYILPCSSMHLAYYIKARPEDTSYQFRFGALLLQLVCRKMPLDLSNRTGLSIC